MLALPLVTFVVRPWGDSPRRQTGTVHVRRGDWVRRMRFWEQSTRGVDASARPLLSARAYVPKARSPDPITTPQGFRNCMGTKAKYLNFYYFHSLPRMMDKGYSQFCFKVNETGPQSPCRAARSCGLPHAL